MVNIIGSVILGIITLVCFVLSFLQFKEKGFLLNNAYIYASKQEREAMDKRPHYRQSGIIFFLLGIAFLIETIDMLICTEWLFYCTIAIALAAIIYAVVSSVRIEKEARKIERRGERQ